MKLYFFSCGNLTSQRGVFFSGGGDEPFNVPVPFYLIRHRGKNILFDSGNHKNDILGNFPRLVESSSKPFFTREEWAPCAVGAVGVEPEAVDYVIASHLHHDHAGALTEFPNAVVIVQKKEYEYALAPENSMKKAYYECEFPKELNWRFIDGEQTPVYDLFGDGRLVLYFTPGHTPGQQSLLVKTDSSGSFMLASDACYLRENIENNVIPGLVCDAKDYMKNIEMFRRMQNNGVKIVAGHDPAQWKTYRHAPEFYD